MAEHGTIPADKQVQNGVAPHLIVAPFYRDPINGATYVHKDLEQVREAWEDEGHIPPPSVTENFGDVESWAAYVKAYGSPLTTHTTWNSSGLRAVLDYHTPHGAGESDPVEPGRCQWIATCHFKRSKAWEDWTKFATGNAVAQKAAVEWLEDHADHIVEPSAADVMLLLRNLKATANSKAETTLREDGTQAVKFEQDRQVTTAAPLPPTITIAIPVLAGHTNVAEQPDGSTKQVPVVYGVRVRVRASVDGDARLALRFSLIGADQVLEQVLAERIAAAKATLGDAYAILRAAD